MSDEERRKRPELLSEKKRIRPVDVVKVIMLVVLIGYIVLGGRALVRKGGDDARKQVVCRSHLIDLWRGMRMYALDWGEHLPPAERWCDALTSSKDSLSADTFRCPAVTKQTRSDYAMNADFGGVVMQSIPQPHDRILIFDSKTGKWNAHDPLDSLPVPARHPSGNQFIMVDGALGRSVEVPARPVGNSNRW